MLQDLQSLHSRHDSVRHPPQSWNGHRDPLSWNPFRSRILPRTRSLQATKVSAGEQGLSETLHGSDLRIRASRLHWHAHGHRADESHSSHHSSGSPLRGVLRNTNSPEIRVRNYDPRTRNADKSESGTPPVIAALMQSTRILPIKMSHGLHQSTFSFIQNETACHWW